MDERERIEWAGWLGEQMSDPDVLLIVRGACRQFRVGSLAELVHDAPAAFEALVELVMDLNDQAPPMKDRDPA